MADRMAVMDCGKIIQVGSTREVYRNPKNRFIADFIGETNLLRGRVTEINRGKGFVIIETPYGPVHSIHLLDGLRTGTEVYCSIRPESLSLAHPQQDHFSNRLKAVIEGVTYLGEIEQYRLAIGEKLELKMTLNNPEGHERKRGEIIEITFHPKDVIVFPE